MAFHHRFFLKLKTILNKRHLFHAIWKQHLKKKRYVEVKDERCIEQPTESLFLKENEKHKSLRIQYQGNNDTET